MASRVGLRAETWTTKETHHASDSEPFVFNESRHSARLLDGLCHLRDCSQLFDVTLIAEEQEFPAHRVVLASCSDYFHAMFTNGLRESSEYSIMLSGVTASALEQLIHFAYTSKLKITKENVIAVLSGASHVQMLPAIRACETYLHSHLTLGNCVEVERLADLYSLPQLLRQVHCFMCQHWTTFTSTPDFLSLSLQQLEKILCSDFPVYCAEVEVARALLAWVGHDLEQRSSAIPSLMALVKVDNLSQADVQELLASPVTQKLAASCSALQSVLSSGSGTEVDAVPGLVNRRGYFETVLLAGGYHQLSEGGASNSILYLDQDSRNALFYTNIPHVSQAGFGLAVLDNVVYVVGGYCNEDFVEVTHPYSFCFNPMTGKWSSLPPMAQERCRFYLGAVDGLLYAVGGEVDNSQNLASCEVYHPRRGIWSPMAPLPDARSELAGTSLGGKLYVSGGTEDQMENVRNNMWCYHPDSDSWTQCAPMLSPRADHTMFSFRNLIYVIGGWSKLPTDVDSTPVPSVDCYNVETNTWVTVQHMKTPRKYCSCTLFQQKVFVLGGISDNGRCVDKAKELDVLDLNTMQWLPDPVSLPSVWKHTAVPIHLPRKA